MHSSSLTTPRVNIPPQWRRCGSPDNERIDPARSCVAARRAAKTRPASGRSGREPSGVEQLGTAFGKGFGFLGTQQSRQLAPQLTIEPLENPADAVALLGTQLLTDLSPQCGAPLVLHMEGLTVVHAVPVPAGHGEDVGALAVGVVDKHVEHRHAAQRKRVLVGQDQPISVLVLALLNV